MILLDIETIPDGRFSPFPPERFEPDGRLTDPSKMRASQESKAQEEWAKRSLSPALCEIVCLAYDVGDGPVLLKSKGGWEEEGRLLSEFETVVRENDAPFVAHNGVEFDFPVIAWRAALHGQKFLARVIRVRNKWNSSSHLDTYQVCKAPLWAAALSVGHIHPSFDGGRHVLEWWQSGNHGLIWRHCEDDVVALRKIVDHINVVWPP